MPFFWTGGFGGGLLTALVAGRHAAHRGRARARPHARPARARAGDAVPRLARPGRPPRRPPRVRRRRPLVARRRQPRRRAAARAAPGAGGPGQPVRDDRVVRSLLRRPARHRPARRTSSAAAAGRSPASRSASPIPTPAPALAPGEQGEIWLRGPNLLRGICGRVRSSVFTPDGFYRTGDLGRARRRRLPLVRRPARRHVQGQGRHGLPVRGRGGAALDRRRAPGPRHRRRRRRRAPRGRRPRRHRRVGRRGRRRGAGAARARSRCRPAGCSPPTPRSCPMSATGKVDKAGAAAPPPGAGATGPREGANRVTRAIDCLVNVDLGDAKQPEWMIRVKEDYFKGGDSFLKSPELPELLEDMDANGVERAILLTRVGRHRRPGPALRRGRARPLRPRRRRLQPAPADEDACGPSSRSSATTPWPTPSSGPASGATACTRRATPSTTRCTPSAASSTCRCA